jgi:hypothetical protein
MGEPRWQFSVRDLLIAMTVISICLAIGVHFAGFMFVLIAIGVMQAGILLAGDWLIRPQNRRALAFATSASWATVGSGLLVLLISTIFNHESLLLRSKIATAALEVCLAIGCVIAYVAAATRWRQLSPPREKSE